MLQPKSTLKRFTREATNEEAARFKAKEEGTPRLALKKSQQYKDTPTKMATRPASPVPSKDLPSKLDAAVKKAKEYKSFDNMPRMKMKQTKTYKG